jgi:hypothetical protein
MSVFKFVVLRVEFSDICKELGTVKIDDWILILIGVEEL